MVESMSVIQQSNSVEIPCPVDAINSGSENMAFYKVTFKDGPIQIHKHSGSDTEENVQNDNDIVNPKFLQIERK